MWVCKWPSVLPPTFNSGVGFFQLCVEFAFVELVQLLLPIPGNNQSTGLATESLNEERDLELQPSSDFLLSTGHRFHMI